MPKPNSGCRSTRSPMRRRKSADNSFAARSIETSSCWRKSRRVAANPTPMSNCRMTGTVLRTGATMRSPVASPCPARREVKSASFDGPILNSPYAYPARHWGLDASGQPTGLIVDARRRADFITPIPKPRKKKGEREQASLMVKALRPERDALEIQFPRVQGYRVELPEEQLETAFNDDHHLVLTPDLVGPSITRNA